MSAHRWLLTAQQRILLEALRRNSPANNQQLVTALYGARHDGGPDTAPNVVRVQVQRLRQRVASVPINIVTVSNRGWAIDPNDLPRVDALLQAGV